MGSPPAPRAPGAPAWIRLSGSRARLMLPAYEQDSLAAVVSRIETGLGRQLADEQFVTAILAEVSLDGTKIELLSCGHPAPLHLGTARPRFVGPEGGSCRSAWTSSRPQARKGLPTGEPHAPGGKGRLASPGPRRPRNPEPPSG